MLRVEAVADVGEFAGVAPGEDLDCHLDFGSDDNDGVWLILGINGFRDGEIGRAEVRRGGRRR